MQPKLDTHTCHMMWVSDAHPNSSSRHSRCHGHAYCYRPSVISFDIGHDMAPYQFTIPKTTGKQSATVPLALEGVLGLTVFTGQFLFITVTYSSFREIFLKESLIFWNWAAKLLPRGVSVGGSKTRRCLCIFIGQRFELNVDRNLNVEGSAEKLVALIFIRTRTKIT